jgi:hypothetical protein
MFARFLISSFKSVLRKENSLYVIDLDDTLFYYPNLGKKWWNERMEYKMTYENKTFKQADHELFYDWEAEVPKSQAVYTDEIESKKLFEDCKSLNSDVIFLTARYDRLEEITKKHINQLYPNLNYPVFFSNEKPKGEKLREIFNEKKIDNKYETIHFIDDLTRNCSSISKEFPNANTYLFGKIDKEF